MSNSLRSKPISKYEKSNHYLRLLFIFGDSKVATVAYNPKKTNVEKIKKAIAKVGYDADELAATTKGYNKLPACCKTNGHKMAH